jgi:hypothetical protein
MSCNTDGWQQSSASSLHSAHYRLPLTIILTNTCEFLAQWAVRLKALCSLPTAASL